MNENVRKIFDMLGVEPDEEFEIKGFKGKYHYDDDLCLNNEKNLTIPNLVVLMLKNPNMIIKLPKEPKKKKLRDLTPKEWNKWQDKNCVNCNKCVFENAVCFGSPAKNSWVYNKDFYSDKFLDQEIEVE